MKTITAIFVSLALIAAASAQTASTGTTVATDTTIIRPIYQSSTVITTVKLGPPMAMIMIWPPPPPPPPVPVTVGTTLRLKTYIETSAGDVVYQWFKNGAIIAKTTDNSLELPIQTPADSGIYNALVTPVGATESFTVRVVSTNYPPFVNFSARGTLSDANPTFITGFVIAHSPPTLRELKTVLIRAVGPTLGDFLVPYPCPLPQIRVYDSKGHEVKPSAYPSPYLAYTDATTDLAQATASSGAFPIPTDRKDVARLYALPSDAYTVHVFSGDGKAGDVLVEIYEVPFRHWYLSM